MFRHALLLLVMTVLSSLADPQFFRIPRNNMNDNRNNNELYDGYDMERDMYRGRDRGFGDNRGGLFARPGYMGPPRLRVRPIRREGLEKYGFRYMDEDERFAMNHCDTGPPPVGRKSPPKYRDDDDMEDIRPQRDSRRFGGGIIGNNVNANSNSNAIGMKYRRAASWGPTKYFPAQRDPSSVASYGRDHRRQNNALESDFYGRDVAYKTGPETMERLTKIRDEHPDWFTPVPYGDGRDLGERDNYSRPSEMDNYNLNTNTNIVGRRSNNMNSNSNRPRRSVDTSAGAKNDAVEISTKSQAIGENWENSRGAIYQGLV